MYIFKIRNYGGSLIIEKNKKGEHKYYHEFKDGTGETVRQEITRKLFRFLQSNERKTEALERDNRRYCQYFNFSEWDNAELLKDEALQTPSPEDLHIANFEKLEHKERVSSQLSKILEIIDTCTPTQKRRFSMYYFDGLKQVEIAKKENTYLSAIQKSIRQVLKKINKV